MNISISKQAVSEYKKACKQNNLDPNKNYIRAYIQSGGTAGLSIETKKHPTDFLVKTNGIKIVVDKTSATFLEGAEIGFQKTGSNAGFTIKMPAMTLPGCSGCSGDAGCCG